MSNTDTSSQHHGSNHRQTRLTTTFLTDYIPNLEPRQTTRGNQPEENNDLIGDILTGKSKNTMRLAFQNVNGLNIDSHGGDTALIFDEMKQTETDILLMSEPNICHQHDWIIPSVRKAALRAKLQSPRILLSTSKMKYRSYKKPGGTMTVYRGNSSSLIQDSGKDKYGRWSWTSLRGKNNTLCMISVYQVGATNDFSNQSKSTKTFRHQLHVMATQENRQGSPKQHYLEDLRTLLEEKKNLGNLIILCVDFNETFSENSKSFHLAMEFGLIDVMNNWIGHSNFSTHQRT